MQISLETIDQHTIRSYSDTQITVNDTNYDASVIIGTQRIIPDWPIHAVVDLNRHSLDAMIDMKPEIIIIGHNQPGIVVPIEVVTYLSKQRIGIECMSIGAACRTFNVLLSEHRAVVVGIIF